MKQIKRVSALLLALLVAMSAMTISVFAEGTPSITMDGFDGETLAEGATVTLTVRYNNFLPFYGFTFLIDYDREALELTDIGYSYIVDVAGEETEIPYVTDATTINLDYVPGGKADELTRPEGVVDGVSYGYIMSPSGTKRVEKLKKNDTIFTITLKAKSLDAAKTAWVKPILWQMIDQDTEGKDVNLVPDVQQPLLENPVEIPVAASATAPKESPYTVSLVPSVEENEVACDEEFQVNVNITGKNQEAYNSAMLELTYDTSLFTYVSAQTGDTLSVTENGGAITIKNVGTDRASGTTLTALTFKSTTVTEPKAGDFTITSAKVDNGANAMVQNAPEALKEGCTVKIVPQFAVIFLNKEGTQLYREMVSYGSCVTTVPDAPAVEYHVFAGWKKLNDTDTLYHGADILKLEVTGTVTYQAAYTPMSFNVTHNGTEGEKTATYGVDYTGSISEFDSANYDYEVTYTVGSSTLSATVNEDGTFTIPGGTIKGDIVTSVSRTIKGVTIELYKDYVAGYTLVVVKGNADAYAYGGNAMYKTPAYGDNAFAYVVQGETTEKAVKALLTATAQARATIPAGTKDVNNTGRVDINDAQAVYNLYNITAEYPVSQYMEHYLRGDVNSDHRVDVTDLNAVLGNL